LSYLVTIRAARKLGVACLAAALAPAGTAAAAAPRSTGGASALDAGHYAGDSRHLGDRWLRQGMQGHDVRVLQQYLTFAGFSTRVTGRFDRATKHSVAAFEHEHGMSPNGIVSVTVERALRQAVAALDNANPPTGKVRINADGTATAPVGAPPKVTELIDAANRIIDTSYCYAGGHGSWSSSCYDCSGAVSFALHGAGLLSQPEDSTELESYGRPGPGRWITIYADASHTFLAVDGRAFDTADFGGPNVPDGSGPRWRSDPTGNLADGGGYVVRHPAGL
jgi:peptidoglycan hydrolase-like protein with peptidoglycan-binding domain